MYLMVGSFLLCHSSLKSYENKTTILPFHLQYFWCHFCSQVIQRWARMTKIAAHVDASFVAMDHKGRLKSLCAPTSTATSGQGSFRRWKSTNRGSTDRIRLQFVKRKKTEALRMENTKTKATISTCLLLTWTYFGMNLFYALLLVTESAGNLTQVRLVHSSHSNLPWHRNTSIKL